MAGNRSVKRGIQILDLVSKSKQGISLKEIVARFEIPKTSGFDIVKELVDSGMIVETRGEINTYTVGLKAFQIGNEYLRETDLITTAKPYVISMAETINKTAFIAVMSEGFVTYLYKYEPPTSIITTSNIGTKNSIHCTSLGKAMLSGMSDAEVKSHLKYITYTKMTDKTIKNEKELLESLKVSRELGYAVDDREIEDHTLCIGSAIYDHTGSVVAGLSVSGFYNKDRDVAFEGNQIKNAALEISKKLGYKG
ncbi:MAG: IclR family transcriptional regulator [Spirochaetaceae bacterium]